jgi:hypothetical protein
LSAPFEGWRADARAVVERAVERHGGAAAWRSVEAITLCPVHLSGLIPWMKGHGRTFRLPQRVTVEPRAGRASFHDYPEPGLEGSFERGAVRIVASSGEVLESSPDHRRTFGAWSKYRRWRPIDALYFFGYALAHYHATPFTLAEARLVDFRPRSGESAEDRVTVAFPPELHTHCRVQSYHFDRSGLLVRHDYTVDVISAVARGAHYWMDYEEHGGMLVATKRHVLTKLGARPVPIVALHAELRDVSVRRS